ncbi:MAG: tRNA (adenosine(37)-N6)-threonylcarbamoyltransferase complex ATPase subunit type 1 TsaE [Verrucomicrobiota bacterium]|nr:tRNA (adenosine(37)-N6)-threonylcarbamoyltransferase complex ATPase subunit type 1 TsaE [Verrucomicrobiota bacterium]
MSKELLWELTVKNEVETEYLAKSRLFQNETPSCIKLEGLMGSGKTFFCKCIANLYGIEDITSNSFLKYSLKKGSKKIFHIDYYDMKKPIEFFYNNIHEEIDDHSLILSEWTPNNLVMDIPQFTLKIAVVEKSERKISFYRT